MTNAFIAFLMAAGASAWVYSKFHRSTGGNTQNALVGAGLVGLLIFIVILTLLSFISE